VSQLSMPPSEGAALAARTRPVNAGSNRNTLTKMDRRMVNATERGHMVDPPSSQISAPTLEAYVERLRSAGASHIPGELGYPINLTETSTGSELRIVVRMQGDADEAERSGLAVR
jgi:hypothetical protein